MTDRLVEINHKDLLVLQNLYKLNGSDTDIGYMTLANYITIFNKDPNVKHIKVYCLNGDFSDGTFVITDRNRAYADTLNELHDNLSRLLQFVDYSTGYRFLGIRPKIYPTLNDSVRKANAEITSDNVATLYHLSKEDAMKFDVKPAGSVQLRPLTELDDLEEVSKMWLHQDTCAFPYVQRLVKYNAQIGAFQNGALVAWIFRLPIGLLGGLKTDEKHCGLGYGSLVTRALSKIIAELGDDVYSAVYLDNMPSHSLFKKLGFKPVGEVYFVTTKINWTLAHE